MTKTILQIVNDGKIEPADRLSYDIFSCFLPSVIGNVVLKTAAEIQHNNNDLVMSQLDAIGEGTLDGAIKGIKELKSGVDGNVEMIQSILSQYATIGLMAIFGLSMVVVALTWVAVILNKLKPGHTILRLPFHLSWFLGWIIGIL